MEKTSLKPNRKNKRITFLILSFLFLIYSGTQAQNKQSVTGKVIDVKSNLPVPFASVVLLQESNAQLLANAGTMSNENGIFKLSPVQPGKFRLIISSVGYASASANVEVTNLEVTDAGKIFLHDSTFLIEEATLVAQRAGGKSESGKTVFLVNKKILDVSNTGTDVLKYIPGIQVDLKQNISLEGSSNIHIYVNGIERSKSFVSQLNPAQIDKVEIINTPSSDYDGSVTGIVNIILKKEKNAGIGVQVNAELPTSGSLIFIYPSMSINYGFKKMNLFTSYNGEINYENIDECTFRKKFGEPGVTEISAVETVRQRNLSHRFHIGFDYLFNEYNQLNYYGSYNPYSYEQNGNVSVQVTGSENSEWNAVRTENDRNTGIFNSLYYKHIFNKPGSEIAFDISHFYLNAANNTSYIPDGLEADSSSFINIQNPRQNTYSFKTDLKLPLTEKWILTSGFKVKYDEMKDKSSGQFAYNEGIYAVYGMINYKQFNTNFNIGLRAEDSESDLKNGVQKSVFSLLPYFAYSYKINSGGTFNVAFNRSVIRPYIYQLNSFTIYENPYSVRKGNPFLNPEFHNNFSIEHTRQIKSSYFSTRLFYNLTTDAINNFMKLNEDGIFETQLQNLGKIQLIGVQFSGTLKAGPLAFNPVIRLYNLSTLVNQSAQQSGIKNRSQMVFEPGFSSVLSFKKEFAFSLIFQYSTPKNNIQDNSYCEALYFVSLDKTIKNKIKVGVVSALAFKRNFIYRGSEIENPDFYSRYEGNLKLSAFPMWFRISYQFHSGASREKIDRAKDEIDNRPKKGF